MAAIASLLGIVDLKKADGIVLATDQVPTLLIGGGRSPLTMPPMSASMVEAAPPPPPRGWPRWRAGGGRRPLPVPRWRGPGGAPARGGLRPPGRPPPGASGAPADPRHTSGNRGTFNVRVRVEDGTTTVTLEK